MKNLSFIKRSNGSYWVGDGFPVRNIFSYDDIAQEMSPFLLMDYAGPTEFEPTVRRRGVGEHPHRGFETVTLIYEGGVSHRDSAGGGGTIGRGDVQWMTAGAGVLHEEFHSDDYAGRGGPFEVVQLWVDLPAERKMTEPAYQSITDARIPQVSLADGGGTVRVIAGEFAGVRGPARTFSPVNLWDVRTGAGPLALTLATGHTAAIFVLRGTIRLADGRTAGAAELAVFERAGTELAFTATEETRLLLLSGEPLHQPVVGHGPFVMTSREEIAQAIADFNSGRFGRIPVVHTS